MSKKLRIYVDTSVFGGVFDIEFMEPSNTLFQQIRSGQFLLCVSEVVTREIELAPEQVRNFYAECSTENILMMRCMWPWRRFLGVM